MRIDRVGPRTWAIALLVGLSVADPGLVTRWGVYVGILLWLTGSPGRFRTDRVFWALVTLLSWTGLTTLWAIYPAANDVFITAAAIGMTFLFARDALRTREQLRVVAAAYLIAAIVAIARLQIWNQAPTGETGRYTIEGLNANYLGYALCGALAVVVLLWRDSSKRGKALLIGATVSVLLGINLTGTRGALIGAACLGLWIILSAILKRPPIRMLIVAVAFAATIVTTGILDPWIRSLEFGGRATGDWSGRMVLWPMARELWSQRWFTGNGPNAMRVSNPLEVDAHSVFLEIGSAQGIIGVTLFLAFVSLALGFGSRGTEPRYRALVVGGFIAASSPAYISGAWEAAPAAMMLLLIFSRVGVHPVGSAQVRASRPGGLRYAVSAGNST